MAISYYPTEFHRKAAEKFVEIFREDKRIMSIILMCSCARGKASKDSCVDMGLIIKNGRDYKAIDSKASGILKQYKVFTDLDKAGEWSHTDFYISTGKIEPKKRDWVDGPDKYELEIGNIFKYSTVLFDRNNYFSKLKKKYLPYYGEKLRKKRLAEVKKYLYNNLDHVPTYVKRGLYFQAFDRLYKASQEFLQAMFIKRRVYPIAYDKWIKEQLAEILHEPDLYKEFVKLHEIKRFESNELAEKGRILRRLAEKYL